VFTPPVRWSYDHYRTISHREQRSLSCRTSSRIPAEPWERKCIAYKPPPSQPQSTRGDRGSRLGSAAQHTTAWDAAQP